MISEYEFRKYVTGSQDLSLVQFRLEWSGACQIISPVYEELANSFKEVAKFFTIDVEKEPWLNNEYGVKELPTILFFKNGKLIDHVTGLIPKNEIISKIENAITN